MTLQVSLWQCLGEDLEKQQVLSNTIAFTVIAKQRDSNEEVKATQ